MEKYILALDQGTTSSRAIIFDHKGMIRGVAQKEFTQHFPEPGWVEHNANEIWESQKTVVEALLHSNGISADQLAGIGITNQRETTIVWNRETGIPVHHAIVWQDRRTAGFCDELKAEGKADLIKEKTGLVLDAYFSGTKLKWILDHVEGARALASDGKLAFGTVDSWLLWNLTGRKVHYTDVSNASRTLLFNLHTLDWDDELLNLFNIPKNILPQVKTNSEIYGFATGIGLDQVPVAGMAGDQQAALFGQMCTGEGMVKNTYGTGCFMLMNTGTKAVVSKNNLLTTVGWKIGDKTTYALEGSVFIAGAAVQWLRDGLKIIKSSGEVQQLASIVDETDGVIVVPAFSGLGAPYWNPYARGTIFGITRGTSDSHIALATIQSIAFQTHDVLKAMEQDAGLPITELRVDGGATVNDLLMQFQSDILSVKVLRPSVVETTALGAAYMAGLAVGFWKDIEEISMQWKEEKKFIPQMDQGRKDELLSSWIRAIKATLAWGNDRS